MDGGPWFLEKGPEQELILNDTARFYRIYDSYQVQDYWESMKHIDIEELKYTMSKDGKKLKMKARKFPMMK